ncbi:MAG: polyhydroxyalkanoate depolymerase [Micavibrio aeruginosavorus]|uniref:Polyhydroxyalkanoate depolymerase n=1 Tax=Micavibrio aeruginosavorus TaxID=349221 RepID=A0A2W5A163_9BACT|nr:MAG: polyhydroxyalkanoate depolymerase [Micavibrio aeruginosavorus]
MFADYAIHDWNERNLRTIFGMAAAGLGGLELNSGIAGLSSLKKEFGAARHMMGRIAATYSKPAFNLPYTAIHGVKVAVSEQTVWSAPYCNLVNFKRDTDRNDPKVLLAAPLSGHYATLLRGTVEALLPSHDVYVTDWVNARDVQPKAGKFGLDDYVSYIKDMLRHMGAGAHVIAVCQPTVPVLAAVSQMAADDEAFQPLSMTLMGGPIDTGAAPTEVTKLAETRPLQWFKDNALSVVPGGYAAAGMTVYPGYKQLTGFMMMNAERHVQSHWDMFSHLRQGDQESAGKIAAFYDEYLAVMDIPADFYIETVEQVFQKRSLAKGEMIIGNQKVSPSAIRNTALLTVEGEKDDISAPGQTEAAHTLCNNISSSRKFHHLQRGCGHYGIFEGRRWRDEICPRVTGFIRQAGVDNGLKYSEIPGNTRLLPSNFSQFLEPN